MSFTRIPNRAYASMKDGNLAAIAITVAKGKSLKVLHYVACFLSSFVTDEEGNGSWVRPTDEARSSVLDGFVEEYIASNEKMKGYEVQDANWVTVQTRSHAGWAWKRLDDKDDSLAFLTVPGGRLVPLADSTFWDDVDTARPDGQPVRRIAPEAYEPTFS